MDVESIITALEGFLSSPNASISNMHDFTNSIGSIIDFIKDRLSNHDNNNSSDPLQFDKHAQSVRSFQSMMTDSESMAFTKTHLYSGLRVLVDVLSDRALNEYIISSDGHLWNLLMEELDVGRDDLEANIATVTSCCSISTRILRCNDTFKMDASVPKLCDLLLFSLDLRSKEMTEALIECIEVCSFLRRQ